MIVAMIAMRMMQSAINKIIDVIAMRHLRVAAVGTMYVFFTFDRATTIRIGFADFDHMFVDVTVMRVMQVSVMKVINMAFVLDGGMSAFFAVLVWMVFMNFALVTHDHLLFFTGSGLAPRSGNAYCP